MKSRVFKIELLLFAICFFLMGSLQAQESTENRRYWLGPEYFSHPMEQWNLVGDRFENTVENNDSAWSKAGFLSVTHLTKQLHCGSGKLKMSVVAGRQVGEKMLKSIGFNIGVRSSLGDYRSAIFRGRCATKAGVGENGGLFIGDIKAAKTNLKISSAKSVKLELTAVPAGKSYTVTLKALDSDGNELGAVSKELPAAELVGNLMLISNYKRGTLKGDDKQPRHFFKDWQVEGTKVSENKEQSFGPVLWTQYTLSRKVMKMVALMAPIGKQDNPYAFLEVHENGGWQQIQKVKIDQFSYTASFRVENWDDSRDQLYRVGYSLRNGAGKVENHYWSGTIRKDPVNKELKVAGFTGHGSHVFPNTKITGNVTKQNPDLLFFSGDQIYEFIGGFGVPFRSSRQCALSYLRRYWMFGWSFRELMKDRPTVIIPDDHDMYQGNMWGQGGDLRQNGDWGDDKAGYLMTPECFNMVHLTQCGQHPDPFDTTPMKNGLSVYYGDMVYGRVSFAIIADREFKSGPKSLNPPWEGRADMCFIPGFDTLKLEREDLKLLGDRQLKFLDHWAKDWRGADAKCVLSATIFANLANYIGPKQDYVIADMDSNGWPKAGRDRAVKAIRKGFGFMYAGDQHLSSIVHHGVDKHGDSGFSFCVPSISATYPRSWRPDKEGRPVKNRIDGLANSGDYSDGFHNLVSVYAVGNPEKVNRRPILELIHDKASGHGMVTFNQQTGEITMECFKLLFDANDVKKDDQFPGWPRTINYQQNYGRKAVANLPTLEFKGLTNPVVQVIDEATNEIIYTLRVRGTKFTPKVFKKGTYTVRAGDQDSGNMKVLKGIKSDAVDTIKLLF